MSLYRAKPADGVAWVTGASTGIGRALARDLAAEGYTVAVTARTVQTLHTLIEETAGFAGKIMIFPGDVTNEVAMANTVAAIETTAGPIALAVFNAGAYDPTSGDALDILNFVRTFEINVLGVTFGLVPVVDRMRGRSRGQIVIVGSATSYFGFPAAAAYGASKAALNNMAESLKHDFDRMNIRIQVVNPGFIDTPATEKNAFAMPALMPVDKAARRMADGIRGGGFEITFPRRLTWVLKLLRILPMALRYAIVHRATGWNKRPLANRGKPKG